jgi:DNA-directed RNA polymerase subunit RPC12/RpoP
MKYFCNTCNKNYSSYKTLWAHYKTFHPDLDIIRNDEKTRNFECEYCSKKFTTKQSMETHIEKTCKKVETKTQQLEKQLAILQKEIREIKSSNKSGNKITTNNTNTNTTNNTNNTTNNTNNTTNNNNNGTINNIIVINKIGTENILDLNDNEIKDIFDKKMESVIKFVQHLNFNKRLPSNHNFCTTSIDGHYLQIYNTDQLTKEKERKKYFFEELLGRSIYKMEQLYAKYKSKFNREKQKQIEDDIDTLKSIKSKDMNDKLLQEMLKKLNLLSYNYKKIVLDTWKNGNVIKKAKTFEEDLDSEDEDIKEINELFIKQSEICEEEATAKQSETLTKSESSELSDVTSERPKLKFTKKTKAKPKHIYV